MSKKLNVQGKWLLSGEIGMGLSHRETLAEIADDHKECPFNTGIYRYVYQKDVRAFLSRIEDLVKNERDGETFRLLVDREIRTFGQALESPDEKVIMAAERKV